MGKFEAGGPHGIFSRKWEDYIKMDLQGIGWRHGLDCSGAGWSRWRTVVSAVMNLRVPLNAGNFFD